MGDYVRMSKRLVTPIYPADANLIVSLFDIHVTPPSTSHGGEHEAPFEILEAGTGHGSLTLHISRAIHGAHPPVPVVDQPAPSADPVGDKQAGGDTAATPDSNTAGPESADDQIALWKKQRRAILHTIDVSARYSKHAEKVVKGFRHGIYAGNVDFHVGDVSDWVYKQIAARKGRDSSDPVTPFISHAFLDLPSTHDHVAAVASVMRVDGNLIIFSPSITQIAECVQQVKQNHIPLHLDQVIELGTNGASGGRQWDVRAVLPRATSSKSTAEVKESEIADLEGSSDVPSSGDEAENAVKEEVRVSDHTTPSKPDWKLVCRPKVGEMIVGGGFLGVFKKIREHQQRQASAD